MSSRIDWLELLNICKETIKRNILPCLETLSEPQPDLGKGAGGDSIKLVDLAAEKAIVETLQKHDLSFTLISEESGIKKFYNNSPHFYITIDPIDGTTNLIHGIPFYCSSIAISKKPILSDVSVGMVIDFFHDLTYFAQKDMGAYCNGKKIFTSHCESLKDAIVGLDINTEKIGTFIPRISNLIKKIHHIRHFGANALELCYVADGKTDAFVDIRGKLRTTDMAAGYLIVKESGGFITDIENSPLETKLDPKTKVNFIASGNIEIHKKILNLVKNH
ncbi:fructose 1,6-bisphosphatase [Candidatus Bathyarchaeota archaeon]|nr:fructose 1,6-bisphosphatase [Candidatus Bathyarchaeota archaeon]